MKRPDTLEVIYAPVADALKQSDELYARFLKGIPEPVGAVTRDLALASRKRLRPALVLLCSYLGAAAGGKDIALACAAELLHSASLVHDDIIDDSDLRRKQATLHKKWNNRVGILAGDLLYAKAFGMISDLGSGAVSALFSQAAVSMCQGEIREVLRTGALDLAEQEYLKILEEKTASLIAACCGAGGILGGLSRADAQRLFEFGLSLGVGFQIVDDCLDLEGDPDLTGKEMGLDVSNSLVTLPLIFHLRQDHGVRRRFGEILDLAPPERLKTVRAELERSGAFEYARERAYAYRDRARMELDGLSRNGPIKEHLARMADFAVMRRY
ncbi:MAG: polyprenyl synthetase family protein [Candidatus Omnitrophica bacterium]|nr:polyprenyl synthetase family protein [Candidatus Omnitrophota bacterium]